jgi:hypothetical protein
MRDKYGNLPRLMERIPTVPPPIPPPSAVDVWVNLHRPSKGEEEITGTLDHSMPSLEYLLNYDTVECHLHAVKTPVSGQQLYI